MWIPSPFGHSMRGTASVRLQCQPMYHAGHCERGGQPAGHAWHFSLEDFASIACATEFAHHEHEEIKQSQYIHVYVCMHMHIHNVYIYNVYIYIYNIYITYIYIHI